MSPAASDGAFAIGQLVTSSRKACGTRTADPARPHIQAPRVPLSLRFDPSTIGTGSIRVGTRVTRTAGYRPCD